LGFEMVSFQPGKETEFEEDVLHFASRRYASETTRNWKCTVVHITDPGRWIDLFEVSRHTSMEALAGEWPSCDAWSFAWDVLTTEGWIHADIRERPQIAREMELINFDAEIAFETLRYDVVTFLQDPVLALAAIKTKLADYNLHVLVHEALHFASDWGHRPIVIDFVHPYQDREVVATLTAFVHHLGGWSAFKQRYLA